MVSRILVGVNGFGRIGRALCRILEEDPRIRVGVINDIADDVRNLAYLYNYDSVYGRARTWAGARTGEDTMVIGERRVPVFHHRSLADVPWADHGVSVVVEASGVAHNVTTAHEAVAAGALAKVVVTHVPRLAVDTHVVMGINHQQYDPARHHVVSSSICDANAIAHPLKALDETFGVSGGSVTTVHPWLSYQNLVDAPLGSQSQPGHYWRDYSLGRMSVGALIPKNTTAMTALEPVLGDLARRIGSFSYRVPTPVVSSADLTLMLARDTTTEEVRTALEQRFLDSPYVALNYESRTSVDYEGEPWSAALDMQWLSVTGGRLVKVVAWYDNEWGYASRVRDVVALLSGMPLRGESA